jgi:hypothetical protein
VVSVCGGSCVCVCVRVSDYQCVSLCMLLSHVQHMTKILVGWSLRRDTPVDLLKSSLVNC